VHLADTVRDARIEEDALGRRRLAGVNVRHDPDVPATIQRCSACHGLSLICEHLLAVSTTLNLKAKSKDKRLCHENFSLPAVVSEGLVGLGHTVNVFLLLHRSATAIGGIEELSGQLLDHALLATGAAVGYEPADGE